MDARKVRERKPHSGVRDSAQTRAQIESCKDTAGES